MSQSEVARLRQQIEAECEVLRLIMHAPAAVASHDVIRNRYRSIDGFRDKLAVIVGEQESTDIAVETYVRIVK